MSILQECEQYLAEAQSQALRMGQVKRIAQVLRDAGIQLSYHNIADYGNLTDDAVEKIFKWNLTPGRNAKLDFEIGSQIEAKGDFAKVVAGLMYLKNHRKQSMSLLAQKSGLSEERVRELITTHKRDVLKEFPEFNTLWTKGATPNA